MKTARKGPVHLRFDDAGKVLVTPEDQDRFVVTVRQAVEGCKRSTTQEQLMQRFQDEVLRACEFFAFSVSCVADGSASMVARDCFREAAARCS